MKPYYSLLFQVVQPLSSGGKQQDSTIALTHALASLFSEFPYLSTPSSSITNIELHLQENGCYNLFRTAYLTIYLHYYRDQGCLEICYETPFETQEDFYYIPLLTYAALHKKWARRHEYFIKQDKFVYYTLVSQSIEFVDSYSGNASWEFVDADKNIVIPITSAVPEEYNRVDSSLVSGKYLKHTLRFRPTNYEVEEKVKEEKEVVQKEELEEKKRHVKS